MPAFSSTQKMFYIWMSDYTFNTLAYQAQKHGMLAYNLTQKDVSLENLNILSLILQTLHRSQWNLSISNSLEISCISPYRQVKLCKWFQISGPDLILLNIVTYWWLIWISAFLVIHSLVLLHLWLLCSNQLFPVLAWSMAVICSDQLF